jgi:hypothetical protein
MRFTTIASAIALSTVAAAQSTWQDAEASTTYESTTTITKTLEMVHTQTMYGPSPVANATTSSTSSYASATSSIVLPATTTPPVVATPTGVSGAASVNMNIAFAVVAAGVAAFWS